MKKARGLKFVWNERQAPDEPVRQLAATYNLSYPVAYTLYGRGWETREQLDQLFTSSPEGIVASPRLLQGAQTAVDRILRAIQADEKILIFGDYDVDGITSTSIMLLGLLPLKAKVNFFLPVRAKHGYGLSLYAVEQAAAHGYKVIITVDNGISAFEPAKRAHELGIDLIITDHHKPHSKVPQAYCIVNPQQTGCPFPHKELAGVGVAYKIMDLLYEQIGKKLPEKVYELLMLGTVADVVPLLQENRYWVQKGLALINQKKSLAIDALLENAQLSTSRISSRDVGFMLTPQINALGRLDDPRDAVKFLISAQKNDVAQVGSVLKKINDERKRVEREITQELENEIQEKNIDLEKDFVIMAGSANWPAGVIGLVAGKLMHNYGRPAFLFHLTKDGLAKGSCRAPEGVDAFALLEQAKDLLISFGGHKAAGGLALKKENVALLKQHLNSSLAQTFTLEELSPHLTIDAPLTLTEVGPQLSRDLERLEPFGAGHEEPVFRVSNLSLVRPPRLMKDRHVKIMAFSQGMIKPILFFNRPELYELFLSLGEKEFEVVGTLSRNEWGGKTSLELIGLDLALEPSPISNT